MDYSNSEDIKKKIDKLFDEFLKNENKYYKKIAKEVKDGEMYEVIDSMEDVFKYQDLYLDLVRDVGKILKEVKKKDSLLLEELVGTKGYITLKFNQYREYKEELDKRVYELYTQMLEKSQIKATSLAAVLLHKAIMKAGYIFRGEGMIWKDNDKIRGDTGIISLAEQKHWMLKSFIYGTFNTTVASEFGTGTTIIIKIEGLEFINERHLAPTKETVFNDVRRGIPLENLHAVYLCNSEQYHLAIELFKINDFKIRAVGDEKSEVSYKGNNFICGNIKSKKIKNDFDKFKKDYNKKIVSEFKNDALRFYKLANKYFRERQYKVGTYNFLLGRVDMENFFKKGILPENDLLLMLLAGFEYSDWSETKDNYELVKHLKDSLGIEMDTKKLIKKIKDYFS